MRCQAGFLELVERFNQRAQVLFIVLPACDRFAVQGAAYLVVTCSCHKTLGFVETQAAFVPFQTAEIHHVAADRFLVVYQVLVANLQHGYLQDVIPVSHEPSVVVVESAQLGKVIGVGVGTGKVLEITGQAGIQRVANAVNHVGVGKQQFNQAQKPEVSRHFVYDAGGSR